MSEDEDSQHASIRDYIQWLRTTDSTVVIAIRDTVRSVTFALLIALLLFSISGIWPPMVAIMSGSMEPEMSRGDIIYMVDEQRFSSEYAHSDTGVVTSRVGKQTEYKRFGAHGDVIIYRPHGDWGETPVIHRAMFWVNESENWYDKANPEYITGSSCTDIPNCPAPHAGFITKGDANFRYDQVARLSSPVQPDWIRGTAEFRIPYIGHIRLLAS